jgi:hypothetical protein
MANREQRGNKEKKKPKASHNLGKKGAQPAPGSPAPFTPPPQQPGNKKG